MSKTRPARRAGGGIGHAEIEPLVLDIAFAEPERDLGLGELGPEIEGMRRIARDRRAEPLPEGERLPPLEMERIVEHMDGAFGDMDAEIAIAHLGAGLGDLGLGERMGAAVMDLEQRLRVEPRQGAIAAGGEHQAAGDVVLGHGAPGVGAHLHGEHVADAEFGADAEQQRRHPRRVGVGEFGEIAGAHQHLGLGQAAAERGIAFERGGEAHVDRIEHRIEDRGDPLFLGPLRRRDQALQIAGGGGDEDGPGARPAGEMQRLASQAEDVIRAGADGAGEFVGIARIDAHPQPFRLEPRDHRLQMGEGEAGGAAEIDHVRPLGGERSGAGEQRLGLQLRRIDDLGEDGDVVLR